ncbi:hypothetical protein MVEN_02639900 [Mycena venus]|uniref:Uncharacterized protein n=1 Tax=Mycena venus TaxID=2733690 RepID=A0A8H6TXW9_9AGAR|nr:hypothetical protein MVEN_02639900 [Mycena venus]
MREDDRADDAEARTHFGIFATRALKQGEEIVVGWEWDDANAVHRVAEVAGLDGLPIPPTPTQRHLISQLANILHALGGTASASTTLHPSSLTSTFPIASSSSSIAHLSTSHPTKSASSLSSKTTPSIKPKRLAGSSVPPLSPKALSTRWGPLISAAQRVRAIERERGSGGWGGVALDREVVLDAATGFVGYGYGTTEGYFGDGFGERYARGGYTAAGTSANEYAASISKPYETIEHVGGWDIVPDGAAYGVKGSETEEDGGGGRRGWWNRHRRSHPRGSCPGQDAPAREQAGGRAGVGVPAQDAEEVEGGCACSDVRSAERDKGKGKAPVQEETMAIDVDGAVDVVAIDAEERPPSPPPRLSLVPPPTASSLPLPTRAIAAWSPWGSFA